MTATDKTAMPNEAAISKLKALSVKAADGSPVKFDSLVNDPAHPKVVVVFIRHFFCGVSLPNRAGIAYILTIHTQFCEGYVGALSEALPPAELATMDPSTKLVVIGCGEPSLIEDYKKRTSCPFDLYADPSRETYQTLDFVSTLGAGSPPSYAKNPSFAHTAWTSFLTNLKAGSKMLSGGRQWQNGGELIWVNGKLEYIYRMANTTDHLPAPDLRKQVEATSG